MSASTRRPRTSSTTYRAAAQPRPLARGRRGGARWPSPPRPAAPRSSRSLDEVRELARDHSLCRCATRSSTTARRPSRAFLKLRGRNPEHPAFLLESAEQGQRVGRYCFIGVRPRSVLRWSLGDDGDPYALAAEEVARWSQAPLPDLPPFSGGPVGYFGYDLVRTVEPLGEPNPDGSGCPTWR